MRKHLFAGLVAIVATVTAVACADAPSAPATAPNALAAFAKGGNGNGNGKGNGNNGGNEGQTGSSSADSLLAYLATLHDTVSRTIQPVAGMHRLLPLTSKESASVTIGAEGGMLQLPAAGAYLWVPPGAVSAPTTFSITARSGKAAAYDFQPAGAVFNIPLVLIQDRSVLNGVAPSGFDSGALAYFGNDDDVDPTTGDAIGSQLRLPLPFSTPQYLAFPVWHFSGYIVSWGRR